MGAYIYVHAHRTIIVNSILVSKLDLFRKIFVIFNVIFC